jgi:hypothetical protein
VSVIRRAISVASRSRRPVWRWKMTSKRCSTSRVISWRIDSAVFFLCGGLFLQNRSQAADLFVHFQQLLAQSPKAMVFLDLAPCLAQSSIGRKSLCHRLALHLAGESVVGTVAGVVGLVAMTARVATAPTRTGDRTGAKVAEIDQLVLQCGPLLLRPTKVPYSLQCTA